MTLKNILKNSVLASTISMGVSATAWSANPEHLEHPHSAGTFMAEYKFMRMNMDGLLKGTDDPGKILGMSSPNYMVQPENMTMDMHMFMPMYNFTHAFSVMAMINYISNSMDMTVMQIGTATSTETMETSGLGDTTIGANYKFFDDMFAVSLDLSIPTGSITESTDMKMMGMTMHMRAPYAMQLGTGTYDVTPSVTYMGGMYDWKYGAQGKATYHIGENSEKYTRGNSIQADAWVRKPVGPVTLSADVSYLRWGAIDGKDPKIATVSMGTMPTSPLAAPTSYGGTLMEATLGVDKVVGAGSVGLDFGLPLYQKLNGIQMARKWTLAVSGMIMF